MFDVIEIENRFYQVHYSGEILETFISRTNAEEYIYSVMQEIDDAFDSYTLVEE